MISSDNNKYIIADNEVHIWHYLLNVNDPQLQSYYDLLCENEKNTIDKVKIREVRIRRIISKAIVKKIISQYLGVQINQVKFSYNRFGRPELSEDINIQKLNFNISHSGDIGIIALVNNYRVGIDVEQMVELKDLDGIMNLCLNKNEKNLLSELTPPERTKLFYKIWTGKEAFTKAIGMGFSFPLKNISFEINSLKEISLQEILEMPGSLNNWQVYNFDPGVDYTSTLVVDMNSFHIKEFRWLPSELVN